MASDLRRAPGASVVAPRWVIVQMHGNVVARVPGRRFEDEIARAKRESGVTEDVELDVFDSWIGDGAVAYRRIHYIPDDRGTAVNVQRMVFGNKGEMSGSGVAFSRDEVTGAPEPSGDFLPNAQGEDVVSGVRTVGWLVRLAAWVGREARRDLKHDMSLPPARGADASAAQDVTAVIAFLDTGRSRHTAATTRSGTECKTLPGVAESQTAARGCQTGSEFGLHVGPRP
jgi:hypothetical protein